ncbi:MAG: hypothetical protein ACLFR0_00370 [Alphaproteobacteria bacterium]
MFSSLLVLMAAPAFINVQGNVACTKRNYNTTQIEVHVDHKPVEILRDRTLYDLHKELGKQLNKRERSQGTEYFQPDSSIDENREWLIGGTSHGNIKTDTNIEFLALAQDHEGKNSCVLFKDVDITISYQTATTIAKDFKEGGCEYNAVLAHEKKRHEGYAEIVDMVSAQLRADIPAMLEKMERGYVPSGKLNAAYANMTEQTREIVEKYRETMASMMAEYNDFLDTPATLEKLASTCEKQKIQQLKDESASSQNKAPAGGLGDYLREFRNKD